MISQVSLSSEIFDALYKAKEIEDREFEDAQAWIIDIIENKDRPKLNYCEIRSCDLAIHFPFSFLNAFVFFTTVLAEVCNSLEAFVKL